MSIRCTKCHREYDATLFQFGRTVRCECGNEVGFSQIEKIDDLQALCNEIEDRQKAEELKQRATEICWMIFDSHFSRVDVEIAQEQLKQWVAEQFPDKVSLYEMIYESRFQRLWEQFRGANS